MKSVCIVGLGYVGLPLALLSSKKGYAVTGIDLDENKIKKINNKVDPISDEYVKNNISNTSLVATNDFSVIENADIVIVCVPTPVKEFLPDLTPLTGACSYVSKHLKNKALLIIESTINPGVCDDVLIPLIEKESNKKVNKDFFISHCPERINPGDTKWNVENIPRVAGSSNESGLKMTVEFYSNIIDAPIKSMRSIKEAEACKVVENSFRDVNIAFVNELAMSFAKLGINVKNVIDGAATKPFAFMPHYPSVGVGGHCIPVDPYYLIEYAKSFGFNHEFLSMARAINNFMPEFTVEQLGDGLNELGLPIKGTRVCVLGLSYKSNVADDRESPSYEIIRLLEEKGAIVTIYDPLILAKSTAKGLKEALKNQDAVILTNGHDEFIKNLQQNLKSIKVFVDGKNIFDRADIESLGVVYRGMGT